MDQPLLGSLGSLVRGKDPLSLASARPSEFTDDEFLEAILDLYKRSLLFHGRGRNEDSNLVAGSVGARSYTIAPRADDEAAVAVICDAGQHEQLFRGLSATPHDLSPVELNFKSLPKLLERLDSDYGDPSSFCWIHVLGGDAAISMLASSIGMHPVARRVFLDDTPQSIVNSLDSTSAVQFS